ncbi:MAG: diguanylate phosphodiesterase, partial [Pseudomonadota bacterium]
MRALTNGFLFFGYVFLAMTAGAFLWRAGLGIGPGVAATLGMLGVLTAIHAIVSGLNDKKALRAEISGVREAHRLLADAMEQTQTALGDLASAIEAGALSRTDELTGEVRML